MKAAAPKNEVLRIGVEFFLQPQLFVPAIPEIDL